MATLDATLWQFTIEATRILAFHPHLANAMPPDFPALENAGELPVPLADRSLILPLRSVLGVRPTGRNEPRAVAPQIQLLAEGLVQAPGPCEVREQTRAAAAEYLVRNPL